MENMKKMGLGILVLAALLAGKPAMALSTQDMVERGLYGRNYWVSQSSSNSGLLNLYYVGSSTEAVVNITSKTVQFRAPYNVPDTDVGNGGDLDINAAAYNTLGEFCSYVDGLTNYGCVLTGGLPTESSAIMLDTASASGVNNLRSVGGYDVRADTGGVSGENQEAYSIRVSARPSSANRKIRLKKCDVNINGATNFKVYGKSAAFCPEPVGSKGRPRLYTDSLLLPELFSEVVADDTTEVYDWTAAGALSGWDFCPNERVLVIGGNSTNAQAAANYVRCLFEER